MEDNYSLIGEMFSPKKSTIQNILNFSKTLSVIKSSVLNEYITLFKN